MPESLGEKLKQAREERGITISEVSEQTRISPLYLESIENDDFRTLPGGIFNKGFVKSFAKYVGIDENEALQDYARLMASQQNDDNEPENKTYRPQVLTDDSSGPSMLPTIIFAAIILGLMTWGIWALVNWWESRESSAAGDNSIAETNVKTPDSGANSNTNVNSTNGQPAANLDSIKVTLSTSEAVLWIGATIDGKKEDRTITEEIREQTFEAEDSLILKYGTDLASTVQLTVNGKKIETPVPPADFKKKGFEYEINMKNLRGILQTGKIPLEEAAADANANTGTNTNVSSNTAAR